MDSNETGGLISTNIIWTGVMLLFGIPQKTASCKAMRQNVDGGSEAWKSRSLTSGGGASPAAPFSSPSHSYWTWERCELPSRVWDGAPAKIEFGGLNTKTFLAAFRWASHEDSEQRQRQFSIKSIPAHSVWLSYTMKRCLLGVSLRGNFTHVHSRISGRCTRGTEVATERQLWREITSRQSCRTHKRPLSVARCLLPVGHATC